MNNCAEKACRETSCLGVGCEYLTEVGELELMEETAAWFEKFGFQRASVSRSQTWKTEELLFSYLLRSHIFTADVSNSDIIYYKH